jgi:transcriptional regulator with XRE-family HTH domain
MKNRGQQRIRAWRLSVGKTMEEAGELIMIDGKAADRATWHGWERKGKIPKPAAMQLLIKVTGVEPNDFYSPPDGAEEPAQQELAFGT